MSFKSNINQYLNDNKCFASYGNKGYHLSESFNQEGAKLISNNTEYIIVGTLTHDTVSRNKGFYYMSTSCNQIQYELIDCARGTNLANLKKQNNINGIKQELIKQKIAFLDVIEEAYVQLGNSNDNDIYLINDATKYFMQINNNYDCNEIKFICNSRNSEYLLKKISKNINANFTIIFCSQSKRAKGGMKQREMEWTNVLK